MTNFSTRLGTSGGCPTASNSYGVELWQPSDRFVFRGWVGYTNTRLLSTADYLTAVTDIFNYAVTLAFQTGKQGNLRFRCRHGAESH